MCFSPEASFILSAFLGIASIFTLREVKKTSQVFFAIIPLLFALQQFSEGFVWLSLLGYFNTFVESLSTYAFLLFALIIWPFYCPLSIFFLEKNHSRKKLILGFALLGFVISAYLFFYLFKNGAQAAAVCDHILYSIDIPNLIGEVYNLIFYAIVTIGPFFISSIKRMWIFGTVLLISLIITLLFYKVFLISIWCFFAAYLSFLVLLILKQINKVRV